MLLLERCKLQGKEDSCVGLGRANGSGWANYFSGVRPDLLGSRAREGPLGKEAVGSRHEHPQSELLSSQSWFTPSLCQIHEVRIPRQLSF